MKVTRESKKLVRACRLVRRFHILCIRLIQKWFFVIGKSKKSNKIFQSQAAHQPSTEEVPMTVMPDVFRPYGQQNVSRRLAIRRVVFVVLSLGIISTTIFQFYRKYIQQVFTATYTWVQNSWSTVSTTAVAIHPDNQMGWNLYTSATNINFANPSAPTLTTSTYSFTDDAVTSTTGGFPVAGGGFANGVFSLTAFDAGANNVADIRLATTSQIAVNAWDTVVSGLPGKIFMDSVMIRSDGDDVTYVTAGNIGTGFFSYSSSTGKWSTLASMPSVVGSGSSLLRNGSEDYIYALAGGFTTSFYRYSISGNSWTTLTPAPGIIDYGSVAIRNGNEDFIYVTAGRGTATFYRYSISGNSWTTLTPAPGAIISSVGGNMVRNGAEDFIYATAGGSTATFYRYSISGNSWTTLTAAPGSVGYYNRLIRNGTEDYMYVLAGDNNTAFYRYSISGNSWTTLTAAPGMITSYNNIIRNGAEDFIYVTPGGTATFYRYSISGNSWTTLAAPPGSITYGGKLVRNGADDAIYATGGSNETHFYRYSISGNSWTGSRTSNLTASPGGISYGSSVLRNGGDDTLYIVAGGNSNAFYSYSVLGNTWTTLAVVPGITGYGSNALRNGADDAVYVVRGNNTSAFYRYSISSNSWTTLTAAPGNIYVGSNMIRNGNEDYIYVTAGNSTNAFYRYSISGNSWTTLTVVPGLLSDGSNMIRNGNEDFIYVTTGNSNAFYRYSISGNSWTTLTVIPWVVGAGSKMIRNGSDDTIYLSISSGSTYFCSYSIAGNTWTILTYGTNGFSADGSLIRSGSDDSIYATGNGEIMKYSVSGNSWVSLQNVPIISSGGKMIRNGSDDYIYATRGGGTNEIYRYIINQSIYANSGTNTSAALALQAQKPLSLSWASSTYPVMGANAVRLQIATSSDNVTYSSFVGPDGTSGTYFTSSPATLTGVLTASATYMKYKAYLQTANTAYTPTLNDVTISYDQYNPSGTLVSSAYNTTDAGTILANLLWSSAGPSGASVQFQVATSSDGSTWSPWVGPSGAAGTYFQNGGGTYTGPSGKYFKYQALFATTNGANSPALYTVTSTYVSNAAPTVRVLQAVQNADGSVTIQYEVKDIDADTDTGSIDKLTQSFQYCRGGSNCQTINALSAGATSSQTIVQAVSSTFTVIWYPTSTIDNFANNSNDGSAYIKVVADDLQAANRYGVATSTVFVLDTKPPVGSIIVDASTTPATVVFTVSDTSTPLQYRLATSQGGLTGAVYGALTNPATFALPGNPTTVFAQFKDAVSNETDPALIYATTPDSVTNFMVQDTTNFKNSPPDYREFLAWKVVNLPVPGFGAYKVYRSLDAINWSLVTSITDRSVNYVTDGAVPALTSVYYKVLVVDSLGNTSFNSIVLHARADGVQNFDEGGGGSGIGPVITNIATSSPSASAITVSWDTDVLANSTVSYSTTPGVFSNAVVVGSMVNNAAHNGEHRVIIANLTPNTTYYFSVKSTDVNGNFTTDDNSAQGYIFHTTPGPTVTTGPTVVSVLNTGATITWQTSLSANSTIFFSTTSNFASAGSVSDLTSYITDHTITLSSLSPATKYYYYVRSIDNSGNIVYDQNVVNGVAEYYSFFTTNDLTPPTITNAQAAVNTTTAAISWHTNKNADSQVYYGTTVGYGSSTPLDAFLTNRHSVNIPNLTPNTIYHYQILSRDGNGNLGVSTDLTFLTGTPVDTTPPVITNVSSTSIGLTYATITWSTSKNTNATVDYGTTPQFGNLAGSLYDFTTSSHSISLTGLLGNTSYYYRVNSVDTNGNSASSSGASFTTAPDITPPTITASSTLVNDTAAFVNWSTNELTNAEVDYDTSLSFTSTTIVSVTSTFAINHSLPLTGLTPETTYYYTIVTADPAANTTTAGPFILQTAKFGASTMPQQQSTGSYTAPPSVPPTISNLKVSNITAFGSLITWNTDRDSNSLVKYGVTSKYGALAGDDTAFTTTHSVPLVNLRPATSYHIKVDSFDVNGGLGASDDIVFSTLNYDGSSPSVASSTSQAEISPEQDLLNNVEHAPMNLLYSIFRALSSNISLKDMQESIVVKAITEIADKVSSAPTIVGIKPVVEVHGNSAIIRWSTDKKTTGLVSFAKETDYKPSSDHPYGTTVVDGDSASMIHSVNLTNLDPGMLYHFQVTSKGEIGPEAKSKDYTFETEAVLPVISDPKVDTVTESEAAISWKTNIPTNAVLEYTNTKTNVTLTSGDTSLVTSHGFTVKDLDSGTPYRLVIKAKNETGNEVLSPVLTFTTTIDTLPPRILNLSSNSTLYPGANSKVQTIISWETDKPATAQVFFQQGVGSNAITTSTGASVMDANLTLKHIVVLTHFRPGTVYKYWVESTSTAGNHAKSDVTTILTPIEKQTIIDIISKNFQGVFGWTKNLGI